jgi:hypothetical protein
VEWLVVVQEEWHDRSDIPDTLRNEVLGFCFLNLKKESQSLIKQILISTIIFTSLLDISAENVLEVRECSV